MAKKRLRSSRPAATPKETPATARELGATLGQTIRGAAPDIVNALIEQAKAGNCTPAKFLFDFAGLCSSSAEPAPAEDNLAALLLRELERRPPASGEETPGTVQ